MKITKISPFTGIEHTMDIDVSQEQWDQYAEGTILIQHCFPKLTPDEREFIKTGITPEEWDTYLPKEN